MSGGAMSEPGQTARDVMLGLMKTCRQLGVSFFHYLGDRLELLAAIISHCRRIASVRSSDWSHAIIRRLPAVGLDRARAASSGAP